MKPICLVGEAFGENEEKIGAGFVGASGIELLKMLADAGIIELTSADYDYLNKYYNTSDPNFVDLIWRLHPEVYRTNVFQRRPLGNKIEDFCGPKATALAGFPALLKAKYVRQEFKPELERLGEELVEQDPNLIIALGNTPLWALAGITGISKVRGATRPTSHTVTGFKLLPTYHPAAVLRQWELRPTAVADLMKARREAEFPEIRRPAREIWIEPAIEDMETFYARYITGCRLLSIDIETSGNQVTSIGFAPSAHIALVVPFVDERAKGRSYWPALEAESAAWKIVGRILSDRTIHKIFQNGLYDIAFLWRSMGLPTYGATHDTMLLHHTLQPESLKSLGFLGSIYSDEGSWKHERKGSATIKSDA